MGLFLPHTRGPGPPRACFCPTPAPRACCPMRSAPTARPMVPASAHEAWACPMRLKPHRLIKLPHDAQACWLPHWHVCAPQGLCCLGAESTVPYRTSRDCAQLCPAHVLPLHWLVHQASAT
jgi:hypothetical protein